MVFCLPAMRVLNRNATYTSLDREKYLHVCCVNVEWKKKMIKNNANIFLFIHLKVTVKKIHVTQFFQ